MMKWIVTSILITATPWVISTASGDVVKEGVKECPKAYVVQAECTGDGQVVVLTGGEGDGQRGGDRHVKVLKLGGEELADRGWLGVSIGEVPPEVAAQFGGEEEGVIVLNVVKSSPADLAGLDIHDIIMSVSGEEIEGDVKRAVELITSKKPGVRVDVLVKRQGQDKVLDVVLGARADAGEAVWKNLVPPLAELEEEIKTHGKILRRGPSGEWEIEDLGNLAEVLEDLPVNIRTMIPEPGSRTMQIHVDDGHRTVRTQVERDSNVLIVERENEGEITVHRIDKNGQEKVAKYANEEELRAGDEEAYEAYQGGGHAVIMKLNTDGLDALDDLDFDFDFEVGDLQERVEAWQGHVGDWQEHLEEALGEAQEAHEETMEELQRVMEEWKSGDGDLPAIPALQFLFQDKGEDGKSPFGPGLFHHVGKPRHTFELKEDGRIEVRIRKGDSELVQLFANEEDLAERNPKLSRKYRELMSADE